MAESNTGRGWWFATPIIIFFLFTGIFWPFVDDEGLTKALPLDLMDAVEITSWQWKRDRPGKIFAVYGTIKNRTNKDIQKVVLELRTEDKDKKTLGTHLIGVLNLTANAEKPFRQDIPRTTLEAMGYLNVSKVIP